jgi:ABC-type phosphate/phosphonate transport system substrate-binding protein
VVLETCVFSPALLLPFGKNLLAATPEGVAAISSSSVRHIVVGLPISNHGMLFAGTIFSSSLRPQRGAGEEHMSVRPEARTNLSLTNIQNSGGMMKHLVLIAVFMALVLMLPATALSEIRIGVLAQRGTSVALQEWGPLGEYLTKQLGEQVTIVPVKFSAFRDWYWEEPKSYIITNSWFFVGAKVKKRAKALLTIQYKNQGTLFGGVIFARRDAGIASIKDLKDKVLMCPRLTSLGGWLFQKGVIVQEGIIPEKDFKKILESPDESHDGVALAVRDRKVDVGTVRTNLLEAMQHEGKIDLKDFVILNPQHHENFSVVCSTPLYPDWPVAAMGQVSPEQAEKLKNALLEIPPGHPVLEQARGIERFIAPLDYAPVEELCKYLKVPPFQR